MSFKREKRLICGAASIAAAAWFPTGVSAQGASAAEVIEEVLVTARRREESLQDVPIAISAFGGNDLAQRGVDRIENLNSVAPNLSVSGGGANGESQARFRVRGLPEVAVYVDGINQETTDGLLTMSVVDVDRIEVLRGPQGTLFGNSSLGGAISYVTRAPADQFGGSIQGTIGDFNRRDIQASMDLPFGASFKSKFTVASLSRDGFVQSVEADRAYGDVNDELARADFLWTPVDALSLRYNIEKSTTDRAGPARQVREIGPKATFTVGSTVYNTNPYAQVYSNFSGYDYSTAQSASGQGGVLGKDQTRIDWETDGLVIDVMRHTLDVNWDLNDSVRIRGLTGYKELTRAVQIDYDGDANVSIFERDSRVRRYDYSQEFQILGSHERFDWVAGGFFSQSYQRERMNTWALPEFTCDLWDANNRQRVTAAEQAQCFQNRKRALGVTNPAITTNAQLTSLAPNLNGVTQNTFSGVAASNTDAMSFTRPETLAFFGDFTFRFTDKLTLGAGVRYSQDTDPAIVRLTTGSQIASRLSWLPDNNMPNSFGYLGTVPEPASESNYEAVTKRLTLQYQWNPNLMTYASYADGYGPGDQRAVPASIVSYMARIENGLVSDVPVTATRGEQTVKNYELGLRADWAGGALRTNLTLFYTDWRNIEVQQYVATRYWDTDGDNAPDSTLDVDGRPGDDVFYFPSLISISADSAVAKGLEFEAIWRATEGLRFNLNLGWLKTEYKEIGAAGEGIAPAVTAGSRFAAAPDYTANIAAQYEVAFVGGAALTPRLDYTYTDDYVLQTGALLQRVQEGYGMLNARLTYDSGNDWSVALAGTNLTDEYYYTSGSWSQAEQIQYTTVGRPSEWGLTFSVRFQ